MPILAGMLFALGLACLLLATGLGWPRGAESPLLPWLATVIGLGAMTTSWGLLIVQVVHTSRRLTSASHRLDAWAIDLQRERAQAEAPAASPWEGVQALLGDLFSVVQRTGPHPGLQPVQQAFEGLGTTSHAEIVTLDALLDETERLCGQLYADLEAPMTRSVEPHPPMEIDRSRVIAILVQVVAAARQQAAYDLAPQVRVEAAEWQAGLLRVRVHATGPLPNPGDPRSAGLALAAATAASLGGSLSTETEGTSCRIVLLLPLDEPDVRTDPTPMAAPKRTS